jgi:hypothetical protein
MKMFKLTLRYILIPLVFCLGSIAGGLGNWLDMTTLFIVGYMLSLQAG